MLVKTTRLEPQFQPIAFHCFYLFLLMYNVIFFTYSHVELIELYNKFNTVNCSHFLFTLRVLKIFRFQIIYYFQIWVLIKKKTYLVNDLLTF